MKKCARCDFEYEDAYDGCPRCAAVVSTDPGPGSIVGAALALLGFFFTAGIFSGLVGSAGTAAVITLAAWVIIVVADASGLKKPIPAGYKMPGSTGTSPVLWGVLVLLLAIIGIPAYFYSRPRIKRAYEIASVKKAA